MTAIILFLLMTAGAIALLVIPFLRSQATADRREFDLMVYQDQLGELERDLERGVIDAEAARAAKVEIERRILMVADSKDYPTVEEASPSLVRLATIVALVLSVPLASGFYYVTFGRPDMPDMPFASREIPQQQFAAADALQADIDRLQQHLEEAPDNGALWANLGRTQLRAGQYQLAVEAFSRAAGLITDNPMIKAEHAEAMVYAAEGQVTPTALEHFETVLETIPDEPSSRYYVALSLAQKGEIDAAVAGWSDLLAVSPSDAPWRQQIIASVQSVLESAGRPSEQVIANLPEGTTASDSIIRRQTGIEALSDEEQNDEIRGMVDSLATRLESEPDDLEGWLMLGRSQMVMGDADSAKDAFERAVALAPDQPDVLLAYASALLEPSEKAGGDPIVGDDAKRLYEQLLKLAPERQEPYWILGLAAAQAGDKAGAVEHWQALLGLMQEDSEDYRLIETKIASLENGIPLADLAAETPSADDTVMSTNTEQTIATLEKSTSSKAEMAGEAIITGDVSGPQPTAEDMAEMARLSPQDRSDRIRAMVDGLAARLEDEPDDIEGWLRLAQSRTVLGEPEAAHEAYRRAMDAAPERPDVIRAYASSLLGDIHPETKEATVSDEAEELYERLIELQPDDPEANWYLGLAAIQEGMTEDARAYWQRVLDVLGPDHPNYAVVQSSLKEMETETQ